MAAACAGLTFTFTGCAGYVEGPGGGAVIVGPPPPPGVVVFGGDYDRGRDEHFYSHRGYESRHWDHGDRDDRDHGGWHH